MGRYDLIDEENSSPVLVTTILIILAAAGGWFYWQYSQEPLANAETQSISLPLPATTLANSVDENPSNDVDPESTLVLDKTQLPEPAVTPLPTLADSDPDFRAALLHVSAGLEPWLQSAQLIEKYMTIANDFSQGLWLEKHMRFIKQSQPFATEKTADGIVMTQSSYRRYDALAAAINAIDPHAALTVYRQFRPLLLQVFSDFGYPADRPLEDLFLKSAAQIIAAPVIEEPIALKKHAVFYKYADDKLEALSPVSKLMLRMGPDNTRTIQNKARQLAEALVNAKE